MRLLNSGFLGLLAAIGLFCSGCHSVGWHRMCYHGSTEGYFPTPAATASSSSSSSSSSSGRRWWSRSSRAKKEHSDNGNHYGQDKEAGKPVP